MNARGLIPALLAAGIALPARGEPPATDPALAALRQRGVARLAMSNEPPWAIVDADGAVAGAGPDLARAVFRRMGVPAVQPVVSSYGALIPGLMAGRSDVIDSGMFMTPARCVAVAYSQPDLCDHEALITRRETAPPRSYRAIASDPTIRIGVPAGGSEERLALAAGVPPARVIPVPDGPSGMTMLETGRIQVYSLPAMSARHLIDLWGGGTRVTLTIAEGTPIMCAGAAFAPGATALRDAYDRALAAIKADGTYARILARYGFDPAPGLQYTRAALCGPADTRP